MTLEEIKNEYSMRDIMARYGLTPNRSGFVSCPFHQGDRTPSLKVYDKDYHCHACGANGDIFTFVQQMENISFKEAFHILGGTYQKGNRIASQMRREQFRKEKAAREEAERQLRRWQINRLGEVCNILRMLELLLPELEPFSDDWSAAINMREKNQYKYIVLTSGTKQELEEMRKLDE